jgi:putative MATE family efflux protein
MFVVRIIQDLYLLVDMFWLSRYSQYAMAVPRQVMPTYMLFTTIVTSICSANLALLSQYIGAEMYEEWSNTFKKMMLLSLLGGVASGTLFYILSPYIFIYFVQTPSEIIIDVIGYASVMSFDIIIQSVNLSFATLLQSIGDTRSVAISQIAGSVANVFLDPLFINGIGVLPAMGAVGAAIATVLSKIVSIFMMVFRISLKYQWVKIGFSNITDQVYLLKILRIASPLLVMGISNSLAFNLQNRLINTFGVIVATAISLGFTLFELANTSLWGLTEGIAIMIGQNLGAGNTNRSKVIARKTALFIFSTVAISSVIMYFARNFIASIFLTGQGVSQSDLEKIYEEFDAFIATTIWTLAFFALTFSAMSIGRGSGHTLMPTIINMVRLWGFRIGLGYLLALQMGFETMGIYIAFALSNIVGGVISIAWVSKGNWVRPIIKREIPIATYRPNQIKKTKIE